MRRPVRRHGDPGRPASGRGALPRSARAMGHAALLAALLGPLTPLRAQGPEPVGGTPPSLGDGLRAIDAFAETPVIDPRLIPPPPPTHVWPEIIAGSGGALVVAGVLGMLLSPGCPTRDGAERCVDARGSAPLWPALVVLGLGATITGSYWYRWTRLPSEDDPLRPY